MRWVWHRAVVLFFVVMLGQNTSQYCVMFGDPQLWGLFSVTETAQRCETVGGEACPIMLECHEERVAFDGVRSTRDDAEYE